MMGFIKNWIVQVLITVIFMVLVDMILPNNNFKKYAKLATGLIVMITIITPVFKLFDRGIDVEEKIGNYITAFQEKEANINRNQIEQDVNKKTIEAYKEKLKGAIEQSIYNETGEKCTVIDITIIEDTQSYNFSEVKSIKIMKSPAEGRVKSVDKVIIGKENTADEEAPTDKNVLEVLVNGFNIDSDAVKFVK
ncbi:MAG: spoIIIAF [Clostridiales bacterium]|jgi:stage III sporulation protein AF|nr:spoIIIAF [Clostridiales bacterium]